MPTNILRELVGEELGSVVFVRDYFQLHFDGPIITVTTKARITDISGRQYVSFEPGFRDALCSQISREVSGAQESDEAIRLEFIGGSVLELSLRPADFTIEAVVYHGKQGRIVVFD